MALIRPDVLVLAAGGIVGEAWMTGVLRGLSERSGVDFREVETFVGTSAGAIVAASLAAGREPRSPGPVAVAEPTADALPPRRAALRALAAGASAVTAPLAPVALAAGAPGGALARRAVLARVPEGRRGLDGVRREVEGWDVRFDGRLRICVVDVDSGRRVVFGSPGAPAATVAEAVQASCAVPAVFRPVPIGGRVYVDGGVWSLTNLDAAPAGRESRVLCLTVSAGRSDTSPAGLLRAAARPAVALEAAALRRRGADVTVLAPDGPAQRGLGFNPLDPKAAQPALEAGYAQGLRTV